MPYFNVLPNGSRPPAQASSKAYLLTDNWDDWFKFSTLYNLVVFDRDGEQHFIGGVKIGQFNMTEDQRRPNIPDQFETLDERFFSPKSMRPPGAKPAPWCGTCKSVYDRQS